MPVSYPELLVSYQNSHFYCKLGCVVAQLGDESECPSRNTPLTVLAHLPTRLLRHLQFVLGPDRPALVARTWDEIESQLQIHPISAAIIDPSSEPGGRAIELQQLMRRYPSLPIIAYVPLTPLAFRTVAELAMTGLTNVLLYSHDDEGKRFLALIDQVSSSPLTLRVVDQIRPRLVMLPLRLAKTVEDLFARPHRYPNAQDIATQSAIPIVRVYRAFNEAGFSTPKKVFTAAKMLRAYSYLGDPAHSVNAVAKKLGYRQTRIFADHSAELFGLNPSRIHTYMTQEQVVARILDWVSLADASEAVQRIKTHAIANQS